MSERAGFFDEFERPARIDSRYRAEHLACRVLGVLIRHLPPAHAANLERYLLRRVMDAIRAELPTASLLLDGRDGSRCLSVLTAALARRGRAKEMTA
jgi:uncharacterized protein (DUF2267 family)